MDFRTLWVTGTLHIAPDLPLAETAAKLGQALSVTFKEDPIGTFDEFPSFSAEAIGLTFALLGIPDPEDQISDEPISAYMVLIRMADHSKLATVECDASSYIADMIGDQGKLRLVTL